MKQPGALFGATALLAGLGYLVWRISRTIVYIGFFVMYAAVGFGLASGASITLLHQLAPLPILVTAAVAFGYFVSAVRSKVFKVVAAATVLIVGQTVSTLWFKDREAIKQHLEPKSVATAHLKLEDLKQQLLPKSGILAHLKLEDLHIPGL